MCIRDRTYTLHVAGLTRELTICKVNDNMDNAAFIMLGDAELTVAAAAELLKKCPDFEMCIRDSFVVMTTEIGRSICYNRPIKKRRVWI